MIFHILDGYGSGTKRLNNGWHNSCMIFNSSHRANKKMTHGKNLLGIYMVDPSGCIGHIACVG